MKNALSFWPVFSKKIVHPKLCQQFVACIKLISHAAFYCYIVIQTLLSEGFVLPAGDSWIKIVLFNPCSCYHLKMSTQGDTVMRGGYSGITVMGKCKTLFLVWHLKSKDNLTKSILHMACLIWKFSRGTFFFQATQNGAQTAIVFAHQSKTHILKSSGFWFYNIITHWEHPRKVMKKIESKSKLKQRIVNWINYRN